MKVCNKSTKSIFVLDEPGLGVEDVADNQICKILTTLVWIFRVVSVDDPISVVFGLSLVFDKVKLYINYEEQGTLLSPINTTILSNMYI